MERLSLIVDEHVPDDCCAKQQHHLQSLVVLNLDAIEIRLHDGHFLQHCEQSYNNIRLFALLSLLAHKVC